jgi:tRNA(Met) C34 N-acetyltransferase TmcA
VLQKGTGFLQVRPISLCLVLFKPVDECFSHKKKRMKELKKQVAKGMKESVEDDPFELFVSSTNIRYCYYKVRSL